MKLCTSLKCPVQKKPYPPGAHGKTRGRRILSGFGTQLLEKQKLRFDYGVSERQLRNYFHNSRSLEHFFQKLETRLDNVVFRLGFASSRRAARQFVSHAHLLVNGKKVDVPSYSVKVGDTVRIKPSSVSKGTFRDLGLILKKYEAPIWLSLDKEKFEAKVIALPTLAGTTLLGDIKLVAEFYSR